MKRANPRPSFAVRVHLRPPKKGERGWWVEAHADPGHALAEVMQECDLKHEPGWIAEHDYRWLPDEHGMYPVTIEVLG